MSQSEKAEYNKIPTICHSGKDKTIETIKRSVAARSYGEGVMSKWHRATEGSETALCMVLWLWTCHYTFVQTHRTYSEWVSPNVNYRFWRTMMCQCRCISCNKCTTLVWDADRWGWGQRVYGNSVLSVLFCCKPKTALTKSIFLKFLGEKLMIRFKFLINHYSGKR